MMINISANPCDTANGGCEQECMNNNGSVACTCTTGILNSDGKKCDPGRLHQYILYKTIYFTHFLLLIYYVISKLPK